MNKKAFARFMNKRPLAKFVLFFSATFLLAGIVDKDALIPGTDISLTMVIIFCGIIIATASTSEYFVLPWEAPVVEDFEKKVVAVVKGMAEGKLGMKSDEVEKKVEKGGKDESIS